MTAASTRPTSTASTRQKSDARSNTASVVAKATRNAPASKKQASTFVVVLPYPPSLNHLWRRVGNKTLLSAEGRKYHATASLLVRIKSQGIPRPPHRVTLLATPPDRRKRDLDNLIKAVLDPVYRGLGMDDSVVEDLAIRWRRDGNGARIEVILEPLAGTDDDDVREVT